MEHNKHQKRYYKECGGSSICRHAGRRIGHKDYGGSGICEHGKGKEILQGLRRQRLCEHGGAEGARVRRQRNM
jgi:hypothetical protein